MAVGKGSMERAAKAAEKKTTAKASAAKTVKAAASGTEQKVTESSVIAAPSEEVYEKIVYQTSSGMLERAAEPNEKFGLGDDMPVYYF